MPPAWELKLGLLRRGQRLVVDAIDGHPDGAVSVPRGPLDSPLEAILGLLGGQVMGFKSAIVQRAVYSHRLVLGLGDVVERPGFWLQEFDDLKIKL